MALGDCYGEAEPIGDEEAELAIRDHIAAALRSKTVVGGSPEAYQSLVAQVQSMKKALQGDALQEQFLACTLGGITACVSQLDQGKHGALLREVLGIHLWNCPQAVRTSLLELSTHLVLAGIVPLPRCLRTLVTGLQPPPSLPLAPLGPLQPWSLPPGAGERQAEVVATITKILSLVPTAPSHLIALLAEKLPHKMAPRDTICLYLHGVFALAEDPLGGPAREGILTCALELVLGMDVDIRWQDITSVPDPLDEEKEEELKEGEDIFELEGQTEQLHLASGAPARGGWEGLAAGAEPEARGPVSDVDVAAEKLDTLLCLLLAHLQKRFDTGSGPAAWGTTLQFFQRTLLAAQRSKFTQYLIWYCASREPESSSTSFVQLLLRRLQDTGSAPVLRSAAACYLGSFAARAAFLPASAAVEALSGLASWCHAYAQSASLSGATAGPGYLLHGMDYVSARTGREADIVNHQVFYVACQALLYLACYRLEGLFAKSPKGAAAPEGLPALKGLFATAVPEVLGHRLDPLRECLPTVADEFKRLSKRLRLTACTVACASSPSRQEGPSLRGPRRGESAPRGARPLEVFFPFDPYLLRKSAAYLELRRTYVRWRMGQPLGGGKGSPKGLTAEKRRQEEGLEVGVEEEKEAEEGEGVSESDESEASSDGDDEMAEGEPDTAGERHSADSDCPAGTSLTLDGMEASSASSSSSSSGSDVEESGSEAEDGEVAEDAEVEGASDPEGASPSVSPVPKPSRHMLIALSAQNGGKLWRRSSGSLHRPISAGVPVQLPSRKSARIEESGVLLGVVEGRSYETTSASEGLSTPGGMSPGGVPMSWASNGGGRHL